MIFRGRPCAPQATAKRQVSEGDEVSSLRPAPIAFGERDRACFEDASPKQDPTLLTSGSLATCHLTQLRESRAVCLAEAGEPAPSAPLPAAQGRPHNLP